MKQSTITKEIIINNQFVGFFLGSDYVAEHE